MLTLSGDWRARPSGAAPDALSGMADVTGIVLDAEQLGQWDSALLVFLTALRRDAAGHGIALDESGLPPSTRRLLALIPGKPPVNAVPHPTPFLTALGQHAFAAWAECHAAAVILGETVLRGVAASRGHAYMRWPDLLSAARDAGIAALPIVMIVNILMGGILAFVGAVQLRKFGADIYVADLVGIAVVREIAALITAVVMSGRTGGAYAAHIATMLGNEEIDALRAAGVPLSDYIMLPRIIALTAMMPLLYLYGSVAGVLGGLLVAAAMLDLGVLTYLDHVRHAVEGPQIVFGLAKSLAFGMLIAIIGCRAGLRAGRGAADAGRAATTAVVAGIVGVIALDAVFAVCAHALDF